MMIEIRKAGFVNKGAELMLVAILDRLRSAMPDALFTMVPTGSQEGSPQPVERIMRAGMYPKLSIYRRGLELADAGRLLPVRLRRRYGLVMDQEVDVVIDAAGFSYSDQWGPSSARELAYFCRRWRKQGTKVILMPQAFGPFKGERLRRYMQEAIENSDLVFAREKVSLEHLFSLVGEKSHIHTAPDFTNLLTGRVPSGFDLSKCRVALVPNYRMIDKMDASSGGAYVSFMTHCAKFLADRGELPFVLVHEGCADRELADQIARGAGGAGGAGGIPIVTEDDPRNIKGILGSCHATVGSRFHGLVSALSQGVPSLATGWSHKYQELFSDYGFPEGVLDVGMPRGAVEERLMSVVETHSNEKLRSGLLQCSESLKAQSEDMWAKVLDVVKS